MVKILDNVLSEETLNRAIAKAECSNKYGLFHGAGGSKKQFKYNWMLFNDKIKFDDEDFINLWQEVKKHVPDNLILRRAYINAHTYGVEDVPHTDDPEYPKGVTIIVYLCYGWYAPWGGSTNIYSGDTLDNLNIDYAVLPRKNRILIFDKNLVHMVSTLSRLFTGVRLTCMFKLEDVGTHET